MQQVRRLYIYFIAAVSLAVLAVGLENLLELALVQLWSAFRDEGVISQSEDYVRSQVSLYTALVVVAGPIWLLHWWLAQRAVAPAAAQAEAERRSLVRALYLGLGLFVPFIFWLIAAGTLLDRAVSALLQAEAFEFGDPDQVPESLALFIVAAAVWTFHAYTRLRDRRAGPIDPDAAWPPRLYLYAATFTGLVVMLIGGWNLIQLAFDALFDQREIINDSDWWRRELANGVGRILTGFVAWALHWGYSLHLLQREDWQGAAEQRSVLRRFYLYLVVLTGVAVTLVRVSVSLAELLSWLLGAAESAGSNLVHDIISPPLIALPFTLAWIYHRLRILEEARRFAQIPLQQSVRRLYTYLVALIGLLFAAVGLAYIVGVLLDLLLGGSRTVSESNDFWRRQVAQFAAVALVGAGAWLWHWYAAQRRVAREESAERQATTRRVYLYVVLAGALLPLLISLAVVLYQILSVILGVRSIDSLISNISTATGILSVAIVLLLYHGLVLREDLAERAEAELGAARLSLILTGPPGADLGETLGQLQRQLPDGYSLQPGSRQT